ncbi:MAG: PaaI family thioesterase [Pseudomonadota bacterium]
MAETSALPAYAQALGIAVHDTEEGVPILSVDFSADVEGRPQFYHGGAIAGLLENAAYAALRSAVLADGREAKFKPVNITVQYLSGGKPETSYAKARITRMGRRNANISVEAWQSNRAKPIASAIMNILMA